jgi:hypothetical protein
MAALDNAALCAAMWRAHGLGVERVDGCVACSGTRPRFYPNVVTVDPKVDPQDRMRLIAHGQSALLGPSSSRTVTGRLRWTASTSSRCSMLVGFIGPPVWPPTQCGSTGRQ